MIYIESYDHMEMPAPCSRCGGIQELNDFMSAYARNGELVCDDCHNSQELEDDDIPDKRFGYCSVCGRDLQLRKNGTVWFHAGEWANGYREYRCKGAGLPPREIP